MRRKPFIFRTVKSLLAVALFFLVTVQWIFIPVRIVGHSMHPTLENHQVGLTFIIGKQFGIERFDVVTVEINGEAIIKRVIGLPNETLEYKDNKLYINDEVVEEPFLDTKYKEDVETRTELPFTYRLKKVQLKQDEYYLMGDNRPRSQDSRFFGPIKEEDIMSKGFMPLYMDD